MKLPLGRKLLVGATGLVLLGGAGGAVAATQLSGGSNRQAFINDAAGRLHVTPTALTSALKGAAIDRISAAVAAGQLTQAQAKAIEKRIQQGGAGAPGAGLPFFGKPWGHGAMPGSRGAPPAGVMPGAGGAPPAGALPRFGGGFGGDPMGAGLTAAAHYLGISVSTLQSDLASGKSLAQIASSTPGKSEAGLKAAMLAAAKSGIDNAVSKGWVTKAQGQQALSWLTSKIDGLLAQSWTGHP